MPSRTPTYENQLLNVVHKPILRLLLIVAATFGLWLYVRHWHSTYHFYEENGVLLKGSQWPFVTIATLMLFVLHFIDGDQASQKGWNNKKFFVFIFFSVAIMAIAIFLTGGFLDSPFSGALALYLGCFILLQKDNQYKVFNWLLLAFTLAVTVGPYIILYGTGHPTYVLEWDPSHWVTCGRLVVSLALLIAAGFFGDKVAEEVRALQQSQPGDG
jgi:hypothetical protein